MTDPDKTGRFSSLAPRWITAALVTFGVTYSCVQRPDEEEEIDEQQTEFLTATGQCIEQAASDWSAVARRLDNRVSDWADAPGDENALTAAQEAWESARQTWQQFEPLGLGPAGSSSAVEEGGAIGGLDLADQIYSWPTINACRVDQGLVSENYADGVEEMPVNARGLDSLEYLLFNQEAESACPATAAIVSDGSWDALTDLPQRRAAYAAQITRDIRSLSERLLEHWEGDEGYANHLAAAGTSGPYEAQGDALKAVTDALFYVEKVVKDEKLAIGLGLSDECSQTSCPEDFEHQQSGASKASIADNFAGFRLLYEGCSGEAPRGLDWLLREKGADMLADDVVTALDGIDAALDAIEEDHLADAFNEDPDSVNDLYDAVKVLTDLLKDGLTSTLEVSLPGSIGGDND